MIYKCNYNTHHRYMRSSRSVLFTLSRFLVLFENPCVCPKCVLTLYLSKSLFWNLFLNYVNKIYKTINLYGRQHAWVKDEIPIILIEKNTLYITFKKFQNNSLNLGKAVVIHRKISKCKFSNSIVTKISRN